MLQGSHVLITGGLGLLGTRLARAVEEAGGTALVTSRSAEKVEQFNREAAAASIRSRAYVLKCESEKVVRSFVGRLLQEHPNVNGLVNNAFADLAYLPVEDTPWSYWEEA